MTDGLDSMLLELEALFDGLTGMILWIRWYDFRVR